MKRADYFDGKKVLVTGGAGFVGSHICERLLELGAQVICVDDMSAGKHSNINILSNNPDFEFHNHCICETSDSFRKLFKDVDTVFHNAASKKNICLHDPKRDLEVNAGGALNLLEISKNMGIRKFVHASTGSVYGEPSVFPNNEKHPLRPVSYYGVSKLAGERYVDAYHQLYGMNTTILRYFHVYGPRQESNEFGGVVSIFLRRISEGKNPIVFGDGTQIRSFTFVKDLVEVNLMSALSDKATGSVYNAASGISVSINELASNMLKISGRADLRVEYGPPLVGDIMYFDIDNSKIRNDLGFTFNTDFWGTLSSSLSDIEKFLSL